MKLSLKICLLFPTLLIPFLQFDWFSPKEKKSDTPIIEQHTSQHNPPQCASDEYMNWKMENDPEFKKQVLHSQNNVLPNLDYDALEKNNGILDVPVVFHVIHDGSPIGTGENVSDLLIFETLQQLNDDFNAQNSNYSSTPSQWTSVIGSADINFCLTVIDTSGLPTNGITRHNLSSQITGNQTIGNPSIQNIQTQTSWGSNFYNIWIIPIPGTSAFGGVIGWSGPVADGSVLDYRWIGIDHRTLTHETGHYLGLPHTWQSWGGSGGCGNDDGLSDTPTIEGPSSNFGFIDCSSTFPVGPMTCGNEHMYVNFMDYAPDACATSFTLQQIAIMRGVLQGPTTIPGSSFSFDRSNLLANSSCNIISYIPIPDTNFEQKLINLGIDTEGTLDGQILICDAETVITLDVSNCNIVDLTGIEAFINLTELDCSSNQLTLLDLSNNHALIKLWCEDNFITDLDMSSQTAYKELCCDQIAPTELTIH